MCALSLVNGRNAWVALFSDPLLSLSSLKGKATTKAGLGAVSEDGGVLLRSVYWRVRPPLCSSRSSIMVFYPRLPHLTSSHPSSKPSDRHITPFGGDIS